MEKLLKRWAERAPDECYFYTDFVRLYLTQDMQFEIPLFELEDKKVNASILLFTMQAIEARGWKGFIVFQSGFYQASIEQLDTGKSDAANSEESPAHALLEAYLKALDEVN